MVELNTEVKLMTIARPHGVTMHETRTHEVFPAARTLCYSSHVHTFIRGGQFALFLPDVVVEWLIITLPILEPLGSNLGPETGYPD
jgi:hypothetical protein